MYRNILVPYDGSEPSNKALAAAIDLASDPEPVTITVLEVAKTGDVDKTSFDIAMRMAGLEEDRDRIDLLRDEYLAAYKDQMREKVSQFFEGLPKNIDIKIVVKRGDPRDVICDYAKENDVDFIIMGRRGISGIRATLGSVSTAVLRNTDLPVMVVK